MSAQLAAYGRLGSDPKEIATSGGRIMAVASLALDLGGPDDPPMWLKLIAFGEAKAAMLCRHAKGEPVSVCGKLQIRRYTTRDGDQREELQCVIDAIVSGRTVRPGGAKRKAKASDGGQAPLGIEDPEDDLPWAR